MYSENILKSSLIKQHIFFYTIISSLRYAIATLYQLYSHILQQFIINADCSNDESLRGILLGLRVTLEVLVPVKAGF